MAELLKDRKQAEELFQGCGDTVVWSCLSGTMGEIFADRQIRPESAAAVLGDFCVFAGKPELSLAEAAGRKKRADSSQILIPRGREWERLLRERWGDRAVKITRYAMKKETDAFDRERLLAAAASLPEGYRLERITEENFRLCGEEAWSRDLTAQYPDYGCYREHGLGVAAKKDGRLAAGASSYSYFPGGIEIEIDTREDVRRKGLAFCCAARLILDCLDRGLYPNWDAHNLASLNLARKLGYRLSHAYTAYLAE